MSDLLVVAIILAFFVFAVWVVRMLGRMIDRDTDPAGFEDFEDFEDFDAFEACEDEQ
jgi:hypothetical protein